MPKPPSDPQLLTQHCQALRQALLDLHRQLLELERRRYEKLHGAQSAGDFLQLVAFSDEMRWLEPLNRLIVLLDEALEGAAPEATPAVVGARLQQLLGLDRTREDAFSLAYIAHFDASPELAAAHVRVLGLLKAGA